MTTLPNPMEPMRPADSLAFAGKHKDKGEQSYPAIRALKAQGVDDALVRQQWGVTLWKVKEKDGKIKLNVDTRANPGVDLAALQRWFEEKLPGFGRVKLEEKPTKKCCGSGCRGCLRGNPDARKIWQA